jgi:hypothetical protein
MFFFINTSLFVPWEYSCRMPMFQQVVTERLGNIHSRLYIITATLIIRLEAM